MSWAVWVLIRTRMSFVNRMHASEPTDAHEIEDDGPALRRARKDVLDETLEVDDQDEDEPEAERALLVDVARTRELGLGGYAQKEWPEARREEEGGCMQLVEQGIKLRMEAS